MFAQPRVDQNLDQMILAHNQQVRQHYQHPDTAYRIPFYQCLITATAASVLIGAITWAAHYPLWWKALAVTFPLAFFLTWLATLARWHLLIERLETRMQIDLNMNGRIGEQKITTLWLQSGGRGNRYDIPTSLSNMQTFAKGVLSGLPLSQRTWSGKGKPFSDQEYDDFQEYLCSKQWAEWVDEEAPTLGIRMKSAGMAVMRHYASEVSF